MRVAAEIALSKEERRRLETWASTRSTSVRLVDAKLFDNALRCVSSRPSARC